ncbi:hypothetical protein ORI89_18985 [Sphingobacterium sp. UT-1RO-CII-1]|uniref:hypothetical protein n=1 Tax=Sphingobacterium sp. UT-1RO-CII-1 TaxID=2995225 RepID=UPI00227D6E96|nr:hypothetical protein [Sphingobacterium sp. UT-1RO-CII-1]MCY4781739.1 hypothetical protein [Sphingobacterium sp. UT-1RO-CII-1]
MANQKIERTVEKSSVNKTSTAVFKGYNLTFNEERQLGELVRVDINGYKNIDQGIIHTVSLNYMKNTGEPSISFTPASSADAELANAIAAELEEMISDTSTE